MSKIKLPHASGNSMSIAAPATNPASDLTLTLPATIGTAGQVLSVDGSGNLVWSTPSIAVIDQWRRTAALNTNNGENFITSDWERVDGVGQGVLGTGMTESSGIFTFPSTGIWHVTFNAYSEVTSGSAVTACNVYTTTDNSSYTNVATSIWSVPDGLATYEYGSGSANTVIDVTDVSQVKVKFRVYSTGNVAWDVSSAQNRTWATFIRLGDT